jgi:hypothetical protein
MAETQDPQRQMAVNLFNYTWELLDKPKRSQEENDTMIHAAHASRFHWGKVGTALNPTKPWPALLWWLGIVSAQASITPKRNKPAA